MIENSVESSGVPMLSLAAGFRPLTVTVGQTVLVAFADRFTDSPAVTVRVMACLALVELTVRRWGWPTLAGAVGLVCTHVPDSIGARMLASLYSIVWTVVVPVLIGAYLRSMRENTRQARVRAVEAEQRRELGTLAARLGERTAVARELHDVVAHHVASIALRVAVARHVLPATGLRERVALVGGRLEAGRDAGGWRLAAVVPVGTP
ncbi:MAG TPA: histidine kinase [Planosporangium sp.]|jgi:signal transduction histidine kinase|nr:histidine kinase [Planosporangium sp.]